MTALIVGSIIPDFEYFMRMENRSRYSHSITGIFWFDLPLGLLVCFLFHNLVKVPLIVNLPYNIYIRLRKYNSFDWNRYFSSNWFKVLCSLLLGVLTHLISDKLTHKSSNLVSSVPGLLETQEFIDSPKSIYRVIQVTFSIIGLALCAFTIWQLPAKRDPDGYNPNYRYWLVLCTLFAATLAFITTRKGHGVTDLVVSAMTSIIISLFISSLVSLPEKNMLFARDGLND